jgi:hypothetical protein
MTKKLIFLLLILSAGKAYSQSVPDMVCHQLKIVNINPQSFTVKKTETDNIKEMDLYKISGGELFISSPNRKEYKYNKLVEIDKLRYYAGHKTLLFTQDYSGLITTHTYDDEIRIGKFRCLTMKK